MTEGGYKVACWLHTHRQNLFVVVLYLVIFVAGTVAVQVYFDTPRQTREQKTHVLDIADEHALRR